MSKSNRSNRGARSTGRSADRASSRAGRSKRATPEGKGEDRPSLPRRAWRYFGRHPILRFIIGVTLLMGLFYALYMPEWDDGIISRLLPHNLTFHARVSGAVLAALGYDITVTGRVVYSPDFAMEIVRGCDALEPAALFLAAVIASPTSFRRKLWGMLFGILFLETVNVVRIVSLFHIGIHFPDQFDWMHVEVWQAVFIVVSIGSWAAWALWATRRPREEANETT